MNLNYGKKSANGYDIVYAPEAIDTKVGTVYNPSKADYLANGYYIVRDIVPTVDADHEAKKSGCHIDGEYIVRDYEVVEKAKVPRVFSKLKTVAVLMKAGYWEKCKEYIESAGLYDLYLAANEFAEDNEYFTAGLAKVKAELGLTDEQVEAILSQCVAD